MKTHSFVKEGYGWYIDLPEYIEKGGSKGDLAMVAGADTMLDLISQGAKKVTITMDTKPFEKGDELTLVEELGPGGGGNYIMRSFEGKEINHKMWLCDVTTFVFGSIPPKIFVRKEK